MVSEGVGGKRVYEGTSPDEEALLRGAEKEGYKLLRKCENSLVIQTPDQGIETYELVLELPFDSDRKRMSVIVRKGDTLDILTKGADSTVLPVTTLCPRGLSKARDSVSSMATEGLRTLVVASRTLASAVRLFLSTIAGGGGDASQGADSGEKASGCPGSKCQAAGVLPRG